MTSAVLTLGNSAACVQALRMDDGSLMAVFYLGSNAVSKPARSVEDAEAAARAFLYPAGMQDGREVRLPASEESMFAAFSVLDGTRPAPG